MDVIEKRDRTTTVTRGTLGKGRKDTGIGRREILGHFMVEKETLEGYTEVHIL